MRSVLALATVAAGLAAGGLLVTLAIQGPRLRRLAPSQGLLVKRQIDPVMDRTAPALIVPAAVAGGAVLVIGDLPGGAMLLVGTGLGALVVVTLVSKLVCDAVNARMDSWSPDDVQAREFIQEHQRWLRGHRARTFAGVVAAAAYAAALAAW